VDEAYEALSEAQRAMNTAWLEHITA
jgi:hypothetical protein